MREKKREKERATRRVSECEREGREIQSERECKSRGGRCIV